MKPLFTTLLLSATLLASCAGEDRSGEQPFPPTVVTTRAEAVAPGTCHMQGAVTASPNSTLQACGFHIGDAIGQRTVPAETDVHFSATETELAPGRYFVVAFARNRMGMAYGDTLWVDVE